MSVCEYWRAARLQALLIHAEHTFFGINRRPRRDFCTKLKELYQLIKKKTGTKMKNCIAVVDGLGGGRGGVSNLGTCISIHT